jgi:hypothetical protein
MTDELRDRIAGALRCRRCEGECPYAYPDEFCQCARDADAVLGVLSPTDGWEQNFYADGTPHLFNGAPTFRRVDGAAQPDEGGGAETAPAVGTVDAVAHGSAPLAAPRPEAWLEAVCAEVNRNNDYGQWASQLHGGWGNDAQVTELVRNIVRLADLERGAFGWPLAAPPERPKTMDTGLVEVRPMPAPPDGEVERRLRNLVEEARSNQHQYVDRSGQRVRVPSDDWCDRARAALSGSTTRTEDAS